MQKLLIEAQLLAVEIEIIKMGIGSLHRTQIENLKFKMQTKVDKLRNSLNSTEDEV